MPLCVAHKAGGCIPNKMGPTRCRGSFIKAPPLVCHSRKLLLVGPFHLNQELVAELSCVISVASRAMVGKPWIGHSWVPTRCVCLIMAADLLWERSEDPLFSRFRLWFLWFRLVSKFSLLPALSFFFLLEDVSLHWWGGAVQQVYISG